VGDVFRHFARAAWWIRVPATVVAIATLAVGVGVVVVVVLFVDFVREHGRPPGEVPRHSAVELLG
jgi:hypothetical protein